MCSQKACLSKACWGAQPPLMLNIDYGLTGVEALSARAPAVYDKQNTKSGENCISRNVISLQSSFLTKRCLQEKQIF